MILYLKPGCQACAGVERLLEEARQTYTRVDVTTADVVTLVEFSDRSEGTLVTPTLVDDDNAAHVGEAAFDRAAEIAVAAGVDVRCASRCSCIACEVTRGVVSRHEIDALYDMPSDPSD